MLIMTDSKGNVVKSVPENIYQGSNNANSIALIAPFSANAQLTVAFRLPNGVLTEPRLATPYGQIPSEYSGFNAWTINVDETLTTLYGQVDFQFKALVNGITVATFGGTFTVQRGVAPILPATPSQTIYNQILDYISSIQQDIVNGWLESKAILPFDATFTYSINALVYDNKQFYKSKIQNNLGNALTDNESWEQLTFANLVDIENAINEHNVSATAHQDIRQEIANTDNKFVRFDASQNLNDIQKSTARSNINALERSYDPGYDLKTYANLYDGGLHIRRGYSSAYLGLGGLSFVFNTTPSKAVRPTINYTEQMAYLSDLTDFITNSVNNLINYYTKSETYSKTEVNDLVSTLNGVRFIVVDELPESGESNAIYLVPAPNPNPNNIKDEYIWVGDKWEQIGSTAIDLSNYATKTDLQNGLIEYIGREQQLDFNATLENNVITATLDESISDFEFTSNTSYLFHIYLPLSTLTGDLNNDYTLVLKDKNGNSININCTYQKDITKTANVFDLCQLQDYDIGVGYSWEFVGHYREITQGNETVRVVYTTDVTRDTNTSMTGQQIAVAIGDSKLKVGTTVACTQTYNQNGYDFKVGHTYRIDGSFSGGELILSTTDITPKATEETYTILSSQWQELENASPYDFKATVTAIATIDENTEVGTVNNQPALFANHGFVVGEVAGQSVTIYSIGQPESDVLLVVSYKGE